MRDEEARLRELGSLQVLDTPAEEAFDGVTRLAAELFDVPIALVSFVDRHRQWFKSRLGVPFDETPRELSFCSHAIAHPDRVMVVPDASRDARFAANPLVTAPDGLRFYAGAPLVTADGAALGTLCLLDRRPRSFDEADRRRLAALARHVMALLAMRQAGVALREARAAATAAREEFDGILRSAPVGIAVCDEEGRCLEANATLASILGLPATAIRAGRFLEEAWSRGSGLDALLRRCRDSGEDQRAQLQLARPGADTRTLTVVVSLARHEAPRRLLVVVDDLTETRQAQQAESLTSERYRLLFENVMDGVMIGDPVSGAIEAANARAAELLGYPLETLLRLSRADVMDPDDERLKVFIERRAEQGHVRCEARMRRGDGELFEAEISSTIFRNARGEARTSIVFRDVTERSRWAARLQQQVDLLQNLGDHVPGVIYQYRLQPDGRSCFPFASKGIWSIYEVTPGQVRNDASAVFARLHPDDLAKVAGSIQESARTMTPWTADYRVVLPQQGERWVRGEAMPERLADGSTLWHGYIVDVTDRKKAEEETNRLAYYDTLTGLPNRRMVHVRIAHELAAARRQGRHGALMFADLDHFKHINDALGHGVGDELLQRAGQRLAQLVREEDTVGRLGGDEFVILLGELEGGEEEAGLMAGRVAEKVREAFEAPFGIGGRELSTSVSIGLTLFGAAHLSADDVLRQADTAMYKAKAAGRNRTVFFAPGMQAEVEERLKFENDLKQAVAARGLQVHVQEQVDGKGRVVGGELLLRWTHPELGPVPPVKFIPIAEETGLIVRLGEFVLEEGCRALAALSRTRPDFTLSVNVSVRQLRSEHFVERLAALLDRSGAPPHQLVLETTESLFVDEWEKTLERMRALAARGIRFSIDDFGTGYSSLSYLQRMPLAEIKIDRSFVKDILENDGDKVIASTIISMARNLGLEVVAEGVETEAQAAYLLGMRCNRLQGFLYARPRPLGEWLASVS